MGRSKILLVGNDMESSKTVARVLSRDEFDVTCVHNQECALSLVKQSHFDIVVVPDLSLPHEQPSGMIRVIRALSPSTEVIISSTHPGMHAAIAGVQESVADYVRLPEELDRLSMAARKAVARRDKQQDAVDSSLPTHQVWSAPLLGKSAVMVEARRLLASAAGSDAPVLLVGERGTGKDAAARFLHKASSRRGSAAFVKVNCASVSKGLIASELFGYERGAFASPVPRKPGRMELAHGGTVFFDDADAITPALLEELLGVADRKQVKRLGGEELLPADVRMVGAVSPNAAGASRLFSENLSTITITLPSLRERIEDLPLLCDHLLRFYATKYRRQRRTFSPATLAELSKHPWPGNVSELETVVSRHAFGVDS